LQPIHKLSDHLEHVVLKLDVHVEARVIIAVHLGPKHPVAGGADAELSVVGEELNAALALCVE